MIMWTETASNGKVRYVERYLNPLTEKYERVIVTMDKDTKGNRKKAQIALQEKISAKLGKLTFDVEKENLILSELVTRYLDDIKGRVKLSTYSRNKGFTNTIMEILGKDVLVEKLTAAYVKKRLLEYSDKPGTTNERLVRFKAMIRWGYENDLISDIRWLDKLTPLKNDEKKKKLEEKFLEASELSLLLGNMKVEKWMYFTKLLALSGMRCGEAIALFTEDIDIANRLIHVTKTLDPTNNIITSPKTDDSFRDIYMQDQLLELCQDIMTLMSEERAYTGYSSKFFISDVRGNHVEYYAYNKYLKETSERVLGKRITTHFLRHTHVALLAEQGLSLDVISRRLGHSDSDVTKNIYFHVTEKLRERDNEQIKNIKIV